MDEFAIAADLGGWEAYNTLKHRAAQAGLRLDEQFADAQVFRKVCGAEFVVFARAAAQRHFAHRTIGIFDCDDRMRGTAELDLSQTRGYAGGLDRKRWLLELEGSG